MGPDVLRRLALAGGVRADVVLRGRCFLGGILLSAGNANPNDWPEYHRTWNAWRYSPLDQINTKNVSKLRVAWIHQPGTSRAGCCRPRSFRTASFIMSPPMTMSLR